MFLQSAKTNHRVPQLWKPPKSTEPVELCFTARTPVMQRCISTFCKGLLGHFAEDLLQDQLQLCRAAQALSSSEPETAAAKDTNKTGSPTARQGTFFEPRQTASPQEYCESHQGRRYDDSSQ